MNAIDSTYTCTDFPHQQQTNTRFLSGTWLQHISNLMLKQHKREKCQETTCQEKDQMLVVFLLLLLRTQLYYKHWSFWWTKLLAWQAQCLHIVSEISPPSCWKLAPENRKQRKTLRTSLLLVLHITFIHRKTRPHMIPVRQKFGG